MRKLSKRINITLVLCVLLTVTLMGTAMYIFSWRILEREAQEYLSLSIAYNGSRINDDIHHVETLADSVENIIISNMELDKVKDDPMAMEAFEASVVDEIKRLIDIHEGPSGWVIFDSAVIEGGHGISFFRSAGLLNREPEYDIHEAGHNEADWWQNALEEGEYWTDPYYWPLWDQTIITYSKALDVEGQTIGTVGADFYFSGVSSRLDNLKIKSSGYSVLMNGELEELYVPIEYAEDYSALEDAIKEEINLIRENSNLESEVFEVKGRYYTYYELSNGWLLLGIPKQNELLAGLYQIRFGILFTALALMGISMLLATNLSKSITHPINDLSKVVEQIRNTGDLSIMADIQSSDEIGNLAHTLNKMLYKIHETNNDLTMAYQDVQDTNVLLIQTLASLAEKRDVETGNHLYRVKHYVTIIAEKLMEKGLYEDELSEKYINVLSSCSIVHDIGKVSIPDSILQKPGKLTDEEFEIMKRHTIYGKEALDYGGTVKNDVVNMAVEVVYLHHEKWNGSGYPLGLSGCKIPLSCRILALADAYDALTTERVYKPKFSHEKAREIIVGDKGTHFDPIVVEAFLELESQFEAISVEYADEKVF